MAALVAGGYLFVTRGRSEPAGTFTPFTPVQKTKPFDPALAQPAGRAGAPPLPFVQRPQNGLPPPGFTMGREQPVVELNSATLAQLETLPGISPDDAKKIMAARPYRSIEDLARAGISRQVIEQISPPAVIRLIERGSPPPAAPAKSKKP